MYADLGRGVFELLWLAGATKEKRHDAVGAYVSFDGATLVTLDAALARGPVLFAVAHTGNWELLAYAAARMLKARGRRLAVVAKPIAVSGIHAFCTRLREAMGLVLLSPRGALAASNQVLEDGDVVAMPIDQVPDKRSHGTPAAFLGAEALCDRAPAVLARHTRATILVIGGTRARGCQHIAILREIRPEPREADFAVRATLEATRALEVHVHETPESWLWLHRRWRDPREQAPNVSRLSRREVPANSAA